MATRVIFEIMSGISTTEAANVFFGQDRLRNATTTLPEAAFGTSYEVIERRSIE
jgi:hypothetical protein